MATPSVLAVFAHPDDESLAAGGLLARQAAAGARTAVVTATWNTGSPRAAELAEALRILRAGEPRMLGFADARVPDSARGCARLVDAPLDEVVRRLVVHIRDFRPEVVVTHDAYGGLTGHPDHVHTHRVAMLGFQAAGLELMYPDAGAPWRPDVLLLATHPHSAVPQLRDMIGEQRAVFSVPDHDVTGRVNVTPWLEEKVDAIMAHRAEVERGALPGLIANLAPEAQARLLATEWYIACGGPSPAIAESLLTDK